MQLQLPIFPDTTKLITPSLGFYHLNGLIYYLHNGAPIFCHKKDDLSSYRYICGNLVYMGLCTAVSLAKALGVNRRNIERYAQSIRKNGTDHHFHKQDMRGQCHKMTKDKIQEAHTLINLGISQHKTAQELGVSEGCIRYHLRHGDLKKKP
jgi:biotin operon repressor